LTIPGFWLDLGGGWETPKRTSRVKGTGRLARLAPEQMLFSPVEAELTRSLSWGGIAWGCEIDCLGLGGH